MRAKVKTSFSNPGSLVQLGVPVLCDGISRAVRQVSYSGRQPSPPPQLPLKRWASAMVAARIKMRIGGRRLFTGAAGAFSIQYSVFSVQYSVFSIQYSVMRISAVLRLYGALSLS